MTAPNDRLRAARKRKYGTATEAARALAVPRGTYIGHENGSRGFADDAARYADFFGVRLEWLVQGRGSMTGKNDPLMDRIRSLPPEKQQEALNYLDFLVSEKAK